MLIHLSEIWMLLFIASGVFGELGSQEGGSHMPRQGGRRGLLRGRRLLLLDFLPQVTNCKIGGLGGAAEEEAGGVGHPSTVQA